MKQIPSDTMVSSSFTLRRYTAADEAAASELWRRTWQRAYPHINFNDRVDWWRQRWRDELVPAATITVAEAKRISPAGLDLHVNKDNTRAIRFYEKQGFVISGEALNWRSGAPVHKMSWRP